MPESTEQFKRAPKRKASKGKRVAMSSEDKAAYAKLIEERIAREKTYAQHLPGNDEGR